MEIFGLLIWALIIYGIYREFKRKRTDNKSYTEPYKPSQSVRPANSEPLKPVIKEKPKLPYKKKVRFFSKSEEAFFLELKRRLPVNFYIFPKVRMVDFIGSSEYDRFKRKLGDRKLMPKHIDFLILDRNYQPIMAIEVNGKSHFSQKQIEIDQFKKDLCESIGLPFEVIKVGDSFYNSINRIIPTLK